MLEEFFLVPMSDTTANNIKHLQLDNYCETRSVIIKPSKDWRRSKARSVTDDKAICSMLFDSTYVNMHMCIKISP